MVGRRAARFLWNFSGRAPGVAAGAARAHGGQVASTPESSPTGLRWPFFRRHRGDAGCASVLAGALKGAP
jgi:hypothetical protein